MQTATSKVLSLFLTPYSIQLAFVVIRFISTWSSSQNLQQYILHGQKISTALLHIELSTFLTENGVGHLGREH